MKGIDFFWGGGGLIVETNCILEYKPPPHFRRDVVYKMGGRINGTLRYIEKEQKYGHITKVQWVLEYNLGLATPHTTKNEDEASYKSTPN